jgi:hypothetical protein
MSNNVFGLDFNGSLLQSSNNAFGSEFYVADQNVFGMKPFQDNFPQPFTPLNIDGCVVWMDAADTTTIDSASPGNEVYTWTNKGSAAGVFQRDGLSIVYTNTHSVNSRNSIYFPEMSTLEINNLTLDFQARTVFVTTKLLTDLSRSLSPFCGYMKNTSTTGAMNLGVVYDNGPNTFAYSSCEIGIRCGIIVTTATNPVDTTQVICFGQDDQSPPDNVFTINGTQLTIPTPEAADSYPSGPLNYFLNSAAYDSAQDMCELIIYNRLLSTVERQLVQTYLIAKWNPN